MPYSRPGPDQAVYVISVAAELAGMHPQTLRIYERRGLLDPARTSGGNRRYSEADVHLLLRIAQLTADGLNLAGVKRVLALEAEVSRLEAELAAARSDGSRGCSRRTPAVPPGPGPREAEHHHLQGPPITLTRDLVDLLFLTGSRGLHGATEPA